MIEIFLLLLIYFQSIFFDLLPITIYGKSVYLIAFILILVFRFYYIEFLSDHRVIIFHVIILFSLILIKTLRIIIYPGGLGLIESIINSIPVYMLPIYLSLAKRIDSEEVKILNVILMLLLSLQALFSILFIIGMPTVNIVPLDIYIGLNTARYFGAMGAANMNSNFNALLAIILLLNRNSLTITKKSLIYLVGVVSILPSGTRLAIISITIVYAYIVIKHFVTAPKTPRWVINLLTVGLFAAIITFQYNEVYNDFTVFSKIEKTIELGGDLKRQDKYQVGYSMLTANVKQFFIGVKGGDMYGPGGFNISDNSLLQYSLTYGVPYLLLYLLLLKTFIPLGLIIMDMRHLVFIIILFLTLYFNNAFTWTPWLYLSVLGFYSIKPVKNPIVKTITYV